MPVSLGQRWPRWRHRLPGYVHHRTPTLQKPLNHRTGHAWQYGNRSFCKRRAAILGTYKPAELPASNSKACAGFAIYRQTLTYLPAGHIVHCLFTIQCQQDKQLNHHPDRHIPPSLLIALNRLLRDSQRGGQFGLRPVQNATDLLDCGSSALIL